MPRTRYNGLAKAGRTRRTKRRTSVATKAKYQAPTARNQRAQILGNARMIRHIKDQMPRNIYCDWEQLFQIFADPSTQANPVTFTTNGREITNFQNWSPCLRQSQIVPRKSSTRVYRITMNIRYTLQTSYWAQISLFVVTLKKDSNDRDFAGTAVLVTGNDYIANNVGPPPVPPIQLDPGYSNNVQLNSDVFKVHYARHVTLSQGGYLLPPVEIGGVESQTNPATTFKKGQVNLKMKMNVRTPRTTLPWTQIDFEALPYYQRYYLITCVSQQNAIGAINTTGVRVDAHMHACTMNSG